MDLTTLKPFGPSILKAKIPEKIVKNINDYIDELISDKQRSTNSDYGQNLAGDVTQEFLLDPQSIDCSYHLDLVS